MSKKQRLRPVDAPFYSYWQGIYLAFYSSRFYVDVAKRWRGYGVLYLLLVVAIALIPLSARVIVYFNNYFDEQLVLPLKKLPPLYIQNGKVEFDKPMPYRIKNSAGETVAIIDTTGEVKEIDASYPELTLLITKDKIFFRPPQFRLFFTNPAELKGDKIYAQSLSKGSNEVFMGKDWVASSGILKLKWVAELLVFPLLTCFVFGLYATTMLFLAFIGQLFAITIFKFRLSFKDACRLFLVASTAQTFIYFGLLAAHISISWGGIFYIILLAFYFSYAVLAVRRESKKVVLK